jgi:methionyl-tRNA formyltransferase
MFMTAPWQPTPLTVLAAGLKGLIFVRGLLQRGVRPHRVVTYAQAGEYSEADHELLELCQHANIEVELNRFPKIDNDNLVFLVGWQFLVDPEKANCIVFHDSLLPNLRGFSPTVTALIQGTQVIGVSAIRPEKLPDTGEICGTRTLEIGPEISIGTALELQTKAMIDLALEILERFATGKLSGERQDDKAATYSLWRDRFDYFIDWRRSATEVVRTVRALGFPYEGAQAIMDGQIMVIREASFGEEVRFAIRDPGKLWRVDGRRALVVCGSGTVWIEDARHKNGTAVHFGQLRRRFLTPDTAWIAPYLEPQ